MWKIESRSLRSGELNEGTVDLIMERATESIFSHGTLSVPLLCSKKRRKHTDSVRERKWTYRVSIKFNRFNRPQKLETRNFTFLLSHRFLASYLKKNSLNSSCFSTVSRKKRWFYKFLRGNVCTSDNRPRLIAIFSFLLFSFFYFFLPYVCTFSSRCLPPSSFRQTGIYHLLSTLFWCYATRR